MKLGPLSLENNLMLAPMLNITTGPYRRFCRKISKIGLVYVPMLYTKQIEKNYKSVENDLHKIEDERPIGIQLIGSNHSALKTSIDFLSSYSFDVLDINAGCPSKRAIKAKEGGYLLTDLELLNSIINTATKYSSNPVSVKVRIGFNNSNILDELIKIINDTSVSFLTVHGRNVKDKFKSNTLDLQAIKRIKEDLNIPVIGNGDIDNPIFAKKFIDYTIVDAIMIGRGSLGYPELFTQIERYIQTGEYFPFCNNLEKMLYYKEIFEAILDEFLLESSNSIVDYRFIELKRNLIWLSKKIVNSTKIRIRIAQTRNLNDLRGILSDLYLS